MKTRLAFAAAALLASLGAAQALPVAPVQQGFDASDVTLIAQGCGAGWYRNAYGQCRPMRRGGGAVVVSPGVAVVRRASRWWRRVSWSRRACAPARPACGATATAAACISSNGRAGRAGHDRPAA